MQPFTENSCRQIICSAPNVTKTYVLRTITSTSTSTMVENNNYNPRWLNLHYKPFPNSSHSVKEKSRNNGLPPRKSRTISVLQNKLYLMSPPRSTRSLVMESFPLFFICLLSLSNSSVSSEPIMSLSPETRLDQGSSTYSLFPDEDLRTGRKIRFQDEQTRAPPIPQMSHQYHSYRSGNREDRFRYPISFDDRSHHRPENYGSISDTRYDTRRDPFRPRGSRVYFDDERDRYTGKGSFYPVDDKFPGPHRNYYDHDRRHYPTREQPSLLDRPLSLTPYRPSPYYPSDRPVPGPSHSKLPGFRDGGDVRIHVFDPDSNSFGNPRNSGNGNSKSFVPSPELFLNHDQYLEYHRKIAVVRDQEFKRLQALGSKPPRNQETSTKLPDPVDPQRFLFTAQQPYDISGLFTPTTTPTPGGSVTQGQTERKNENTQNYHESHSNGHVAVAVYSGNSGEIAIGGVNKNSATNPDHDKVTQVSVSKDNSEIFYGNDSPEITTTPTKPELYDVQEGQNSKSLQIKILPEKRPNFISKSGRRLAFDQIQRQSQVVKHVNVTEDHEHTGYPKDNPARETLISSFPGFAEVPQVFNFNIDNENDNTKNHKDTTTTTPKSTTSALIQTPEHHQDNIPAKALSLIEIPNEADGFIQLPNIVSSTGKFFKILQKLSLI